MKEIKLSIIIVSFNTKDFLLECLSSITERVSKKISYEIIVVDNNSADGSASAVKEKFPQVILIPSKDNNGFSKANNMGVKKSSGEYVLFLNPDTLIYENTLETMISFMEKNSDAGAATCFIRLPDGTLDDGAHRGFPTPWNAFCYFSGLTKLFPKSKLFAGYTLGWMDLGKTHCIDALVGAFMLVRRTAGESVNWWDEDYFFYGEDLDFCYQLKEKKWKIYFVPEVSILHYKGVSAGVKKTAEKITTADKETKIKSTVARFNAMQIFYKKHYVNTYPRFITWLVFKGISLKKSLALQSL